MFTRLITIALGLSTVYLAMQFCPPGIPQRALVLGGFLAAFVCLARLFVNRRRPDPSTNPISVADLVDDEVERLCVRLDLWLQKTRGLDPKLQSQRLAVFKKAVKGMEVHPSGGSPRVHYNAEGTKLIMERSENKATTNHELLHVYQEIAYGVLRREWEGRLSVLEVLYVELEDNWFSKPWLFWTLSAVFSAIFAACFWFVFFWQ